MCVFNGDLCVWDGILDSHKLFYFFLHHVSLIYFIYVPADFGKVLLALICGGNSKSRVFKNIYT